MDTRVFTPELVTALGAAISVIIGAVKARRRGRRKRPRARVID